MSSLGFKPTSTKFTDLFVVSEFGGHLVAPKNTRELQSAN